MDKPVSLAERIAACCPCRVVKGGGMACDVACRCWKIAALGDPACVWPGHALEADAKALEMSRDGWRQDAEREQARVEALEAVLNGLRANVAGCWGAYALDLRTIMGNTNYAVVEEMLKRAAALADEPRKEDDNG